jgi:hypothetical protein
MVEDTIMSAERHPLVCLTVTHYKKQIVVPGSEIHQCESCGAEVWVSPSGLEKLAMLSPTCQDCAIEQMAKGEAKGEESAVFLLPKALDELREIFGDDT